MLLSRFVEEKYIGLSEADKKEFDSLLDTQDPQLTEWLCFDAEPPAHVLSIVGHIRRMAG